MPAVWAYSSAAPGKTCADARLLGRGTKVQYPAGSDSGQAGWDIGLSFATMGDLSERLSAVVQSEHESITRLAINVHGMPGKIDADSKATEAGMYDYDKLWNRYSSQLVAISHQLGTGATVLLMGCNIAKGDAGADFLMKLSNQPFSDHKVVGFTTIGETLRQYRRGENCTEPGMRDTPYDNPSEGMPIIKAQREAEALTLPWASETSPHVKIALNGAIILGAEASVPATDYSFQNYLPGTWTATIGNWNGYFVFSQDGSIFWMGETSPQQHPGKWWTMAGCVQWSFSDDAPGSKRTFEVLTPLKSTLQGTVTINSMPNGFFIISKQF